MFTQTGPLSLLEPREHLMLAMIRAHPVAQRPTASRNAPLEEAKKALPAPSQNVDSAIFGGPRRNLVFVFLHNVIPAGADGPRPYRLRFGKDFGGKRRPLGAAISYFQITEEDKEKVHKFNVKMLPCLFIGYHQLAGVCRSGGILAMVQHQLEKATYARDVHVKRLNDKCFDERR